MMWFRSSSKFRLKTSVWLMTSLCCTWSLQQQPKQKHENDKDELGQRLKFNFLYMNADEEEEQEGALSSVLSPVCVYFFLSVHLCDRLLRPFFLHCGVRREIVHHIPHIL